MHCKILNNSPSYKASALKWEGDFIFAATDENKNFIKKIYIDLWHGDCRGARALDPNGDDDAEYVMQGPYENWIKVAKKELDPIQGLMTGKFKLKGKMATIMRFTKAASELVNAISKVDTEF